MPFFDSVHEAGARAVRHNMKWVVETDRMLFRDDAVSNAFFDTLRTRVLSARMSEPNYGERHPTPGAAKVPEILKGGIFNGRI